MPQYELNLRDYLRILRKRNVTIIVTFLVVMTTTVIYTPKEPIIYETSATVKIEERKTIAGLITEEFLYNPADRMASETKIITGYPVMKRAAELLGMINAKSSLQEVNDAAGNIQGSIAAEKVGDTNMILIKATADTAQRAMDLSNTVAQAYIEENLSEKRREARAARQFIEEQLSSLENRLKQAEERLGKFNEQSKNLRLAGSIKDKLVNLEFTLAELLQKYTDKHPKVLQTREQIRGLEAQMKGLSGQELEYARMQREVEVNKKLYDMLKEKLEEARIVEAQKVPDISLVDPATLPGGHTGTDRNTKFMIGGLLGVILGLALAFAKESLDTSIATIEDVENIIKLPVLGVIPSITYRSKEKESVLEKFKRIFLPVTKSEGEENYIRLIVHYEPRSPVAEAYRNLRTNLKFDPTKKSILITSTVPREGKTTLVSNLGLAVAQKGTKTLLVSSDLRRPQLHKVFGLEREPGINEIITGKVRLEEALRNVSDMILGELSLDQIIKSPGMENIWVLTSGNIPRNPAEILESPALASLIKELENRFEVIIFDSPPALPVTDASILANKVDSVVLCYEAGRTSRDALKRTKMQLESVGAKISGVILNHIAPQTESVSAYPYYYRYKYRYYGKEEDKEEKPVKIAKDRADKRQIL